MNSYFKRLYTYNDWANSTILDTLEAANVTDEYVVKSISHVVNAQFIWLRRVANHQNSYKIWEVLSYPQMRSGLEENKKLWMDYLDKATPEEFARVISYSNSAGDHFENTILDCVAHCVNHATYHRAQVAKAIRDLGVIPPNTDYITYCRKFGN